jgi:GntP family gluconate:H+ symporter
MFSLHPLIILFIGMMTVILIITLLRMNAFIALITAAIVVSLLSPGDLGEKIKRVAESFGSTAGSIGIVIALAVVIGKCMMDSGAADRIVRGFLSLLGEKRSSTALMASGFVLSIPVFFDTVFYLLVPLARSMHRRTKKHYLKYAMAIAAGGVITHSLVPPTPGPLVMVENLGIDIGFMIILGALVALPSAFTRLDDIAGADCFACISCFDKHSGKSIG